jgi:hypothetical protein
MSKYDGETSVPTDDELIRWGWKTNQISQLRKLTPELQNSVLQEYIRRIMENCDSDFIDF